MARIDIMFRVRICILDKNKTLKRIQETCLTPKLKALSLVYKIISISQMKNHLETYL